MKIPDDTVRNALISISAGLPVVGGPLSFILDKYTPSEIERKRNAFLNHLDNDVKQLKDKIYIKNMYTPEFQSVFNFLLQASFTEHRNEKITVFRSITQITVWEHHLHGVSAPPSLYHKVFPVG